jgi:hypothetical protein
MTPTDYLLPLDPGPTTLRIEVEGLRAAFYCAIIPSYSFPRTQQEKTVKSISNRVNGLRYGFVALALALGLGLVTTASAGSTPGDKAIPTGVQGNANLSCALNFTDVPPTDEFYPYVMCLACKSIIGGYACGVEGEPCNENNDPYFRPNLPVTRGQISKIVALSAGFIEPVPAEQQTFADVLYGSTFWEYVERLASREVMQGYPCGGDGEPCDDQNRPYFRPFENTNRGQLMKIVNKASGNGEVNSDTPENRPTFTDVPETHTFYTYVEGLLAQRPGLVRGYACGGAGEPCNSTNDPYFRPEGLVTRAQTSKVVSNAFFPECAP